jgi:hypothetical protein
MTLWYISVKTQLELRLKLLMRRPLLILWKYFQAD